MINRWDELAETYLDEEFFNRLIRKENSYEYLPKNNSVQFWGDYKSYSQDEKRNILSFVKNYFSKMTIAQVITLNDIVPYLDNFQIKQKLIGSENGIDVEMFNKEIIRYATSELTNYLLSKSSEEMLSDYKSIMIASKIIINTNEDLQSLDLETIKEKLLNKNNSTNLVGQGIRGRAELWRIIRPGLEGSKDLRGNTLFDYKMSMGSHYNGLEITESGIFKYRLHDGAKDFYMKSFFGKMFDVPLDKDFEKELKEKKWADKLEDIFEVITSNKKNDMINLLLDSHFPEYKVTEKAMALKLVGFSNYKNIESVFETMDKKIEENFSFKLNGEHQIIKNEKVKNLVKNSVESLFASRLAMKEFNFSGLEWNLSEKSPNLKLLYFFKKYNILNFKKNDEFKGFNPKIMTYKDEPEKKYIVINFANLWISNISNNYLLNSANGNNKNKITFIEKISIFAKAMEDLNIKIKNEFKYLYIVNLYREKNNEIIPFNDTEISDLKDSVSKIVLAVLENKEISLDEFLADYDAKLMKREVKLNIKNKEKLRKF